MLVSVQAKESRPDRRRRGEVERPARLGAGEAVRLGGAERRRQSFQADHRQLRRAAGSTTWTGRALRVGEARAQRLVAARQIAEARRQRRTGSGGRRSAPRRPRGRRASPGPGGGAARTAPARTRAGRASRPAAAERSAGRSRSGAASAARRARPATVRARKTADNGRSTPSRSRTRAWTRTARSECPPRS